MRVYLKPDEQKLVFDGFIYNRIGKEYNLDSKWRWRCIVIFNAITKSNNTHVLMSIV